MRGENSEARGGRNSLKRVLTVQYCALQDNTCNCYSLKVGVCYVSYVEPTTDNNVAPSELVNGSAIYNFIRLKTITL